MQEVKLINTKISSVYRKGLVPLLTESQLQLPVIEPSIMINSCVICRHHKEFSDPNYKHVNDYGS
jgi:hypothetical protein